MLRLNKSSLLLALTSLLGIILIILAPDSVFINSIILIYSLFTFAVLMPMPALIDMISARFLMVVLLSAALFQLESLVLWKFDWRLSQLPYILMIFVLVQVWLLISRLKAKTILPRLRPRFADLAILGAPILICLAVLVGAARHGGLSQSSIVQSLGFGLDDGSHLSIFGDEYRAKDTLLLGSSRSTEVTFPAFSAYPKGWHLTSAIYTSAFMPNNGANETTKLVSAYFIAKIITLLLTIASLSLSVYAFIANRKNNTFNPLYIGLAIIVWSGFLSVALVLPSYWQGFFSYLPALMYTLLFAAITISVLEIDWFVFAMLALCVIGSAMSWLLVAPPLFISLLALLPAVSGYGPKKLFAYTRDNLAKLSLLLVAFLVVLIIGVAQVLYNEGLNILSASGGIVSPPDLLTLVIFLAFFGSLFYFANLARNFINIIKWAAPLLLFTTLIILQVLLRGQTTSYYYSKTLTLLLTVLAVPITATLIGIFSSSTIIKGLRGSFILPSTLTLLFISVMLMASLDFAQTATTLRQVTGSARVVTAKDAAAITSQSLKYRYSTSTPRLFFIFPNDPSRGIIDTHLARQSHPLSACDDKIFKDIYSSAINQFAKDVSTCATQDYNHYFVYTDDKTATTLLASSQLAKLNKNQLSIVSL